MTEESRKTIFSSGLDALRRCEVLLAASKLVLDGLKAVEEPGLFNAAKALCSYTA